MITVNCPNCDCLIHVDDSRKKGRWEADDVFGETEVVCSACHKYWILKEDKYDFNFCPRCGADLRGE